MLMFFLTDTGVQRTHDLPQTDRFQSGSFRRSVWITLAPKSQPKQSTGHLQAALHC